MNRRICRLLLAATIFLSLATNLTINSKAFSQTQDGKYRYNDAYVGVINRECTNWTAPATTEANRGKKLSVGYQVTVYPEVINSTLGDGKKFYKTVKGTYILCKCLDGIPEVVYDNGYYYYFLSWDKGIVSNYNDWYTQKCGNLTKKLGYNIPASATNGTFPYETYKIYHTKDGIPYYFYLFNYGVGRVNEAETFNLDVQMFNEASVKAAEMGKPNATIYTSGSGSIWSTDTFGLTYCMESVRIEN